VVLADAFAAIQFNSYLLTAADFYQLSVQLLRRMQWLHAPISSSEVLSELLGQGNRTRRTTRLMSTYEVLVGVFWLTGKNLVKENRKE